MLYTHVGNCFIHQQVKGSFIGFKIFTTHNITLVTNISIVIQKVIWLLWRLCECSS